MLYQFLLDNREEVLALSRSKTAGISEDRPVSSKSQRGLPKFYAYLVRELKREARGHPKRSASGSRPSSPAVHGEELSRLGYTVSQVVHGYGVLCQAITELAEERSSAISAGEFSTLNLCLDTAIADAVTGFAKASSFEGVESTRRMGFLVHELRNALSAALIAHSLIKKGVVGIGGSTNALLERNLRRMRDILDRSFAEVRMQNDRAVNRRLSRVFGIVEEVEATAGEEASLRGLTLKVDVPGELQIECDRNYLVSALSNVVQNAIKYSKPGGVVSVRARDAGAAVVLEVEDRCGGLPAGAAEELFKPFTQKASDRTGLGLGLSISRQAVELNGGVLAVRDLPGVGCVFSITLPKRPLARSSSRAGSGARRQTKAKSL